jgi:opacity protein-like surface antigen
MKKAVKLLAISLVAISASTAMAESGKWYIGVGAGQSSYSDWSSADITGLRDEFGSRIGIVRFEGTQSADADDNTFGYKLFGGYSFHENIAVEFSYIDMGEVDANSSSSGTFYDAMDNFIVGDTFAAAKANVDAITLDVALNFPITSVAELIVIGGVYGADTKLELDASSSLSTENFHYSNTAGSSGLHYGIGINFKVTDVIGLRAEWERLDNVEAKGGESDVDLLSAALVYNF